MGGGGDAGWPADSGLWVGSVEDPDPRSWYVMNWVYFECSVSRTWPVCLLRFPQTDGFISFGVLLCQLKRWRTCISCIDNLTRTVL